MRLPESGRSNIAPFLDALWGDRRRQALFAAHRI
jgi:hypothetical protein